MIKRVINEDTRVYFFDIGSELNSGNLTKGTRYLITKKAEASSVIPTGLQVDDIFLCQKDSMTLAEGDAVKPLVMSKICGFQNIDGTMDREQVDVTALCDETTTYRAGRLSLDLSGTLVVETSNDDEETATDIVMGNLITLLDQQTDDSYNRSTVGETKNVAIILTEGIAGADVKDLTLYTPVQISSGGFSGGTNSVKTGDVSLVTTTGDFKPQFVKEKRIAA